VLDNVFDKMRALDSDVIWCEWADQNAFEVQNLPFRGKKILRIHAYEVYQLETYAQINPMAFDHIIFVNSSKLSYYENKKWGTLPNAIVLPNYIDMDKFTIPENKEVNNNIAFVGQMSRKKGIGELLLIATAFPNYNFHLVGEHQEDDIAEYFEGGLPKNVIYHGKIDNDRLPEFYAEMTYIINTSMRESFGVSIYEAMACGVVPIVRMWVGSNEWYRTEWCWDNLEDIDTILHAEHKAEWYRDYVEYNANPKELMQNIFQMITTPKPERAWDSLTVGIVKTREEYLPKLLQSLRAQSCLSHYEFNVHIIDNMKKRMTIGEAFNQLADECTTDLILYLGDDDWLDECYIENCMKHYELRKEMFPEPIGIVTSCLYVESEFSESYPCSKMPTGFWKAQYVRDRRFNEDLPQQIDSEFVSRVREAQEKGEPTVVLQIESEFGYYYRQHGKNVSGDKITDAVRKGDGVKNGS